MKKKENFISVDPGMANINSHEFTLGALAYLSEEMDVLEKKIKRLSFKHTLLTIGIAACAVYLYKKSNKKDIVEEKKDAEVKEETKE